MLKKTLAIVSVMAVVLTMGITAFAFAPDTYSYLPTVGGWQIGTQNTQNTYSWEYDLCPTCGVVGYYLYEVNVTESYHDKLQMGDVIAIADATNSNGTLYNDSGLIAYFTTDDPHEPTAHRAGLFCLTAYGELFTTLNKSDTPFRGIIGGFNRVTLDGGISPSWERVEPIYRANCVSRNSCVYYATSTFAVPLYSDEIEMYILTLEERAYNVGLANGTQNSNAYTYISEVIDGVTDTVLDALYDINVMGISLLHLVYLCLATFLIMFIIKITRGA